MINEYTLLLIKQYWEKPRAKAEIELLIRTWKESADLLQSIPLALDVDLSVGAQNDYIGRIVGISRNAPSAIELDFFGFDLGANTKGFSDKTDDARESAPFFNKLSSPYTSKQMQDPQYKRFIKAKIAINSTSAFMMSDDYVSVQDAVQAAFNGQAYVVDNQDMTLTLFVSPAVPEAEIRLIQELNLLPKPQGVKYDIVIMEPGGTFGFSNNVNSKGFGDRFNFTREGGYLARRSLWVN